MSAIALKEAQKRTSQHVSNGAISGSQLNARPVEATVYSIK
jgi:hypothetical protein